jgi:hypothetical protein
MATALFSCNVITEYEFRSGTGGKEEIEVESSENNSHLSSSFL